MKKIILDTNFLMLLGQFKIDIFSELERICHFSYEIFILDRTLEEMDGIIRKQKGNQRDAAKLSLSIIRKKGVKVMDTEGSAYADSALLGAAEDKNTIIATQDAELKKKLQEKGSQVIILRQKKHLVLM